MTSSDDYQGRFKALQAAEDAKDVLINDVLSKLEVLRSQRDEAKSDLETEREARRRLQRSLRDSNPNRPRFALLILHLDADIFLFDDQWMRQDPATGGEKMAAEVVGKVKDFVKKEVMLEDSTNVQVNVKIYGDLFKLWRMYEAAGSNLGSSDLTRFFSHFNRFDSLVDFVDFGPRKGSIERKLSGLLAHYLEDSRVEHILFGAPSSSISPILAPLDAYLASPMDTSSDHRQRLTLLTVPPNPKDWNTFGIRTTSHLDSLFTVPPGLPPAIPPRSSSHTPRIRSPSARFKPSKEHHKAATPSAPSPPPAAIPGANMPKLRIRKEEGAWVKDVGRHERSPPRQVAFGPPMVHGRPFAPMQIARRDTYPVPRYPGVPPEAPSIPGMHWP